MLISETIKFKNASDDIYQAVGSSLKGYLKNITTNQLIEAFGEPNYEGTADGKVSMEWLILTEKEDDDGNIESSFFTLYDWKGSRPDNPNDEWDINVGGKSKQDYFNAIDALDIINKTDFLYAYDGEAKICQDKHNLYLLEMCKQEVANG